MVGTLKTTLDVLWTLKCADNTMQPRLCQKHFQSWKWVESQCFKPNRVAADVKKRVHSRLFWTVILMQSRVNLLNWGNACKAQKRFKQLPTSTLILLHTKSRMPSPHFQNCGKWTVPSEHAISRKSNKSRDLKKDIPLGKGRIISFVKRSAEKYERCWRGILRAFPYGNSLLPNSLFIGVCRGGRYYTF